jgi:hypothetical protein
MARTENGARSRGPRFLVHLPCFYRMIIPGR